MTYTDTQLKQALAKMLPDEYWWNDAGERLERHNHPFNEVLDTELLHLCWLVEENLTRLTRESYLNLLYEICNPDSMYGDDWNLNHATWQQRVIALAKAKGVEIA